MQGYLEVRRGGEGSRGVFFQKELGIGTPCREGSVEIVMICTGGRRE